LLGLQFNKLILNTANQANNYKLFPYFSDTLYGTIYRFQCNFQVEYVG